MKKKNILLLVIITLFLTGCTFEYKAKIMLDGSVREEVNTVTKTNEIYTEEELEKVTSDTFKKVVKIYLDNAGIKKAKIKYYKDRIEGKTKTTYNSLYSYSKDSKLVKTLYDGLRITKKNGKTLIESIDSNFEFGIEEYYGSTISISLPYKVTNSNADSVDKSTNTYSWNLDEDFTGISLEYKNRIFYTLNVIKILNYATIYTYFTIAVILIIIIFVIFLILYYYRAKKLRNN